LQNLFSTDLTIQTYFKVPTGVAIVFFACEVSVENPSERTSYIDLKSKFKKRAQSVRIIEATTIRKKIPQEPVKSLHQSKCFVKSPPIKRSTPLAPPSILKCGSNSVLDSAPRSCCH